MQGEYAEAEKLFELSQVIQEKVLGPEHVDLALLFNNRAGLLQRQVRDVHIFEENLAALISV